MAFRVHPIRSKDILKYVLEYSDQLGWLPGKMDVELMWASGPGFYVGEINGARITSVSMVEVGHNYGYVSYYFCDEKHRGKGYAYKTWKTARASVSPEVNLALDAELSFSSLYEREGFKRAWGFASCAVDVSSVLEAYRSKKLCDGVIITPATEVDFTKLKLYVEDAIGFTFVLPDLLQKWITLPTHTAMAATDTGSGAVVGFVAIRETMDCHKNGYNLAPLLADSASIARALLYAMASKINNLNHHFNVNIISQEFNPCAAEIRDEVKAKHCQDVVRMYTKHELPMKKEKNFSVFVALL